MCRNKPVVWSDTARVLQERAEEIFWKMSGYSADNPPSVYQMEELEQTKEKMAASIRVDGVGKWVPCYKIQEDGIWLEEQFISWKGIPLKDVKKIQGIYVFLLGEPALSESSEDGVAMLYEYMWQNAYLDAAREAVKQRLEEQTKGMVSSEICPGFYGMELEAVSRLHAYLQGETIGVTCGQNCLSPEKSVIGMHFLLSEPLEWLKRDCAHCLAAHNDCRWCMRQSL